MDALIQVYVQPSISLYDLHAASIRKFKTLHLSAIEFVGLELNYWTFFKTYDQKLGKLLQITLNKSKDADLRD